ncbi:hypothetical protein E6O75_ATG09888 [Venturia nashicola]|uniref:Apoptosis regulator Bcl-2 family BH4 domain-containing protein n=1 Tax=Venturia nashicola TaxID=86259 RepID=A0A4Z1NZS3_9PEZI|nr:hypothetical protein E6O75_ATG09888 [Venturia nashicola]
MFSFLHRSNPLSYLTQTLSSLTPRPITLPNVSVHDIETLPDKRTRTLKHLVKANHHNHSIIYHDLQFANHAPHILGSAYLFGATGEHLNDVYESEGGRLEGWRDSPGEVGGEGGEWRRWLGEREYQRAFVDFFEDQLVQHGYDWRDLLKAYLFEGEKPLINNMICGLAHPLIHLGYGYELSCRTIAIEALALACCFHNFMSKYLDDPSYTKPANPSLASTSPLELLSKIAQDKRFNLFSHPNSDNIAHLFEKQEAAVLEYWNGWELTSPQKQFEDSQKTAAALLVGTHGSDNKYDFFAVHLLTSSHAVRILLPLIPAEFQLPLIRQWWLFTIAVYIAQLRPTIDIKEIEEYEVRERRWEWVAKTALTGRYSLDAHYVKALRAMKEAAETWAESGEFFLKAAVKFADEFSGWGGFGQNNEAAKEVEDGERN